MFKLKLRAKLLTSTILTTTIVCGTFLIYNSNQLQNLSKQQAYELAESYAENYSKNCKNFMDTDMGFAKAIADISRSFHWYSTEERDTVFGRIFKDMLVSNPNFISVWNTIELKHIDSTYTLDYGRKSFVMLRKSDSITNIVAYRDMEGLSENSVYYQMKKGRIPSVMEPYIEYDYGKFYITSLTVPVFRNNEIVGLGGIDFPLESLQEIVDSLDLIEGASAFVSSYKGVILGHTDTNRIGDTITNVLPELNKQYDLLDVIHSGISKGSSYIQDEQPYYTSIVPFYIDGTATPWAFSVSLPIEPFLEAAKSKSKNIIWLGFFGLGLIYLIIYLLATQIVKPLINTTRVFKELASGNINSNLKLNTNTKDELEEMSDSVNILIDNLQATESFAHNIENGNLDVSFEAKSKNDSLGNALIQMRNSLRTLKSEEDKRRYEDDIRNWELNGLAKLGDLLRNDSTDSDKYLNTLIKFISEYTKSSQGAIYIISGNENSGKQIILSAQTGFKEGESGSQVIELGEGLIGVSIRELKTISLENLPSNYFSKNSGNQIKSGSLIIVPLKNNDEVIGAVELASAKKYQAYHVKFIEDVAERMATTIESLRMQQNANKLLEQTRLQAEEMMSQEEELRQNMEEMMATQEENTRTIEELQQKLVDAGKELKKRENIK